jgi:AcrR family transcriptional regulator
VYSLKSKGELLPLEIRQENLRERMLAAALKLFSEKGYSATSIEEITAETGVTKGAFYYYFRSKDEVLEILHDQFLEYELAMARAVKDGEGDPPTKLRKIICDLIESIVLYKQNVVVFFKEVDYLPQERKKEIERRRLVYQQHVEDVIRDGISKGYFRPDLDPLITTLGIFGLCNYTYRWLNPNGRLSVHQVSQLLADMVLSGVEARR